MLGAHYVRKSLFFIRSFFPLQLLFGHLKYNLFATSFWILLFLIVSDNLGFHYGIPFLFYSPEYNGEIGIVSFGLLGFAFGGFTAAFNTYSYMKMGNKYPFLATLSRPFLLFSLNNAIIPLVFNCFFIYRFSTFQLTEEFATSAEVYKYVFSYLVGFTLFIVFTILYFFPVNRNVFKLLGDVISVDEDENSGSFMHNKIDWSHYFSYQKDRIYIYLFSIYKLRKSRSIKHYDKELLKSVLSKTKINSSFFEIVTIIAFIVLGLLRDTPLFEVPAAMSFVTLLTIILMLFSALRSWVGYWSNVIFIGVLLVMNHMSLNTDFFQYKSYAYGLNYAPEKAVPFNIESISELNLSAKEVNGAKKSYEQTMNHWKQQTGQQAPKMIFILTSGGGSRSALWTFSVLQQVETRLKGELFKHVHLISGASGGMLGAAYYRGLVLKDRTQHTQLSSKDKYTKNMSKDLLNKLIFSAYSNDIFYRMKFNKYGNTYTKDRGYAFEQQLHSNTEHVLDVPLGAYKLPEKNALIPTMVFAPTIIDNGRRLLISSQNLSFLCQPKNTLKGITNSHEYVDFQSFFKSNVPDSLRFGTILRMNATFPFVLPMVSMPTKPSVHIMDAGLRDNYGTKVMIDFIYSMREWIKRNTSGIIVLQIRDTKRMLRGDIVRNVSMMQKFTLPFGNMYDNFPKTQDFDQEQLMNVALQNLGFPVNYISFNLLEEQKKRISLSWHLTSQEKARVKKAFYSRGNKYAMYELTRLLRYKK